MRVSPVDFTSVADADDEDAKESILDGDDDAVIADTVAPQRDEMSGERLAHATRVGSRPRLYELHDLARDLAVQVAKLLPG